jgi:hypothetical protein
MTFHVGQKVVCISTEGLVSPTWIKQGGIYTIREIRTDKIRFTRCKTYVSLLLVEVVKPLADWGEGPLEPGYSTVRFKPAVSKSIQLFRDIAQGVTDRKPIIPDDQPQQVPLSPETIHELIGGGAIRI